MIRRFLHWLSADLREMAHRNAQQQSAVRDTLTQAHDALHVQREARLRALDAHIDAERAARPR